MTEQLQRLYQAVHSVSARYESDARTHDKRSADKKPGRAKAAADLSRFGKSGLAMNETKTAKLLRKGRLKVAQKVGEEAVEVVIAAIGEDRHAVIAESADLLYHLVVLWNETDVKPDDVWAEMRRREKARGLAEKL